VGRSPEPESGAGEKLRNWVVDNRDDAVREAAATGLSIACIRKITGPRRGYALADGAELGFSLLERGPRFREQALKEPLFSSVLTHPARAAVERPPGVNLHLHGVSAEDIAVIIRRHHVLAGPAPNGRAQGRAREEPGRVTWASRVTPIPTGVALSIGGPAQRNEMGAHAPVMDGGGASSPG
jgi:hypothetical protein